MKKILSLIITVALITGLISASVMTYAAADPYEVVYFEDFEPETGEAEPVVGSEWAATSCDIVDDPASDGTRGNVFKTVGPASDGKGTNIDVAVPVDKINSHMKWEADFYFENTETEQRYVQVLEIDSEAVRRAFLLFNNKENGIYSYYDTDSVKAKKLNISTPNEEWIHIVAEFDYQNHTYDMYMEQTVEGQTVKTQLTTDAEIGLRNDMAKIRITFGADDDGSYDLPVYVDNFKISAYKKFEQAEASVVDGFDAFAVNGKINYIFTMPLDDSSLSAITVKKGEDTLEDSAVEKTVSENVLTVGFTENLDYSTEYTVEISTDLKDIFGQELQQASAISFKTLPKDIFVSNFNFTETSEGYTASVDVKNENTTPKTVKLYVTVCDEDGELKSLTSARLGMDSAEELPSGATDTLSASVAAKGSYVYAFVTDGDDNLLLSDIKTIGSAQKAISSKSTTVSITEYKIEKDGLNDKLIVKGNAGLTGTRLLLLKVADASDKIDMLYPLYTEADGSFDVSYILTATEGNISISVGGIGITNIEEKDVFYLSDETRNIIKEAASAADAEKIGTLLEPYKDLILAAVPGLSDDFFKYGNYVLLDEATGLTTYDLVVSKLLEIQSLETSLNNADWITLGTLIENNSGIIFGNDKKIYTDYKERVGDDDSDCMKDLADMSPFDSIYALRALVDDLPAEDTTTGSGNTSVSVPSYGGGGGGGGSASAELPLVVEKNNDENKEDEKPVEENTGDEQNKDDKYFADIAQVEWAAESILRMNELGIMAGDGNGSFRPDDSITREEFVKVICVTFGIEISNDAADVFSDVNADSWYAPYVNTAYEKGIVSGMGDGTFGVGQNISREDMATMICSALEAVGVELKAEGTDIDFADSHEISDYALESVLKLVNAGVFKGNDANEFSPEKSATRAETACVIDRILNVWEALK